ncbi:uncharacterized protein LOC116201102 isoform X2 [Punica granatum]|uniref:Uncharacterized protein n=2 Tax=Punica granatum TaxID=22663 RepID=A0A2I0INI5_PUNGR|nr:uncharacterized protein LOC116201102 isoform X2 [Punica granatum]PKI45273.1 hypothetical protein CRG98_034353 [Punica granatum]
MKAAKPKNGNGGLAEEYSAESRRDEDEDEDEINGDTVYELYSPLHYLQQLMKVFLRRKRSTVTGHGGVPDLGEGLQDRR